MIDPRIWVLHLLGALRIIPKGMKLVHEEMAETIKERPKAKVTIGLTAHTDAILALESAIVAEDHSEPIFVNEQQLRERYFRPANTFLFVVEYTGKLVGYITYDVRPDALYVTHIGVHPTYRRRGLGARLTHFMRGRYVAHNSNRLVFVVPDTADAMIYFMSSEQVNWHGYTAKQFGNDIPEDHYAFVKTKAEEAIPVA